MAIAFRSSTTNHTNGATDVTITITKPTGTLDNDILIAVISGYISAAASISAMMNTPSGWTKLTNQDSSNNTTQDVGHTIFWKKASSEGASYTFTSSATVIQGGAVMAFSGASGSSPFNTFSTATSATTSATTPTAPSITGVNGTMLVAIYSPDNSPTLPGTLTSAYADTSPSNISIYGGYVAITTGGATGTYAMTGTAGDWVATTLLLQVGSSRTMPATVALLATNTRTMPATVAVMATKTRTVTATIAVLATSTRTMPSTVSLTNTKTRTIPATAALIATRSRTVPASLALLATNTRSVLATAALFVTVARTITVTAALATTTTNTRTMPTTIALIATATRIVPTTAALMATVTRIMSATVAVIGGGTRTIPASIAFQSTPSRITPATVALALTIPIVGTYTIIIGGVSYASLAGTLSIMSAIGRRSQASFQIKTTISTHFQQYQAVAIYDRFSTLIFSGYVTQPKEQKPGYIGTLIHDIICVDQHYLADKRIIAAPYASQTCGYIVNNIITNYLASEGVTVGQVNAGPTIDATFVYVSAAAALDALATRAGFYWQIDQFKQLYFVPYTAIVNSTVIDGSQIDASSGMTVERGNPNYRNTQYVLGGVAQTTSQTETRKGDGTATAFTFSYPFATAPTITVNGTAKTRGIKGVNTSGYDWYWAKGDPILAQDTAGTKLISTDTLSVTYIGQYSTVVISTDPAQIVIEAALESSTGIVESVTTDSTIQSTTAGFSLAGQLLARYAAIGTVLKFWTKQSGFNQGQAVTVNLPDHALNSVVMLIESVTATDASDGLNIWYQVTAVMGPYDTTWVEFFASLLASQQAANSINIGVSQTIAILAAFTATWPAVGATLNTTVFVCPICGPSTLCGLTTIVC